MSPQNHALSIDPRRAEVKKEGLVADFRFAASPSFYSCLLRKSGAYY